MQNNSAAQIAKAFFFDARRYQQHQKMAYRPAFPIGKVTTRGTINLYIYECLYVCNADRKAIIAYCASIAKQLNSELQMELRSYSHATTNVAAEKAIKM